MRTITNSIPISGENMFIFPSPQHKTESPNQYPTRNFMPFYSPAQTVITSSNTMQNTKANFNSSLKYQSSFTLSTDCGEKEGLRPTSSIKAKPLTNKKFSKMPMPSNNNQIEVFVKNLLDYLSIYKTTDYPCIFLKTKLLTRYEDYMSNGLERHYFIVSLYRMQKELISLICMDNESLVIHT